MSVVVQNVTGEPRQHEKTQEPAHNGWFTPDGAIALLTAVLAFVTWRLVVHTRALVGEATSTSKRQAEEMKSSLAIAKQAADATKESVGVARTAFLTAHRPRMVIRRLAFVVSGGHPVELNYTVHNVGDVAGTIIAKSGAIWLPNDGESLASAIAGEEAAENTAVGSGDNRPITNKIGGLNFNYGLGPRPRILFVGYLKYADSAGIVRETRFLREYSHDTKLFTAIKHPDYEYQD